VLVLILAFRSSQKLATLYGFAVTGTFLIDTTLFLIVAASMWHWSRPRLITIGVLFGVVELAYFGANVTKIASGGWLPLCIALVVSTVMLTWQTGRRIVTERRTELEGPLQDFVDELHERKLVRVPGTAVFPHPTKETTPLALRANVEANHVLHEHVVLVSVKVENVPYVHQDERVEVDQLVHRDDGIVHVMLRFGFQDEQDIPESLQQAVGSADQELDFDCATATYFISRLALNRGATDDGMATWRKRIFIGLAHNAANPAQNFCLPIDRTVVMGSHLDL
jgi:KUP system potassium uptake protein